MFYRYLHVVAIRAELSSEPCRCWRKTSACPVRFYDENTRSRMLLVSNIAALVFDNCCLHSGFNRMICPSVVRRSISITMLSVVGSCTIVDGIEHVVQQKYLLMFGSIAIRIRISLRVLKGTTHMVSRCQRIKSWKANRSGLLGRTQ